MPIDLEVGKGGSHRVSVYSWCDVRTCTVQADSAPQGLRDKAGKGVGVGRRYRGICTFFTLDSSLSVAFLRTDASSEYGVSSPLLPVSFSAWWASHIIPDQN